MPPQQQNRNAWLMFGGVGVALVAIAGAVYYLRPAPFSSTTSSSPSAASNTQQGSIRVIYPNGGETLKAGETVEVKWEAHNIDKVFISMVHGGKEFGQFEPNGTNASDRVFKWIVPDMSGWGLTDGFKIFINNGSAENDIRDVSDGTFTILSPGKG